MFEEETPMPPCAWTFVSSLKRGAWISFLKVPILTEFLSISDSMNHGRWFFGKLKQAEWRGKNGYKAILPEGLELASEFVVAEELLSGVLQIPRKPGGWKEAWALIISDGRWETFVMPLGETLNTDLFTGFSTVLSKELGMFPFFPMTSEVDVSSH